MKNFKSFSILLTISFGLLLFSCKSEYSEPKTPENIDYKNKLKQLIHFDIVDTDSRNNKQLSSINDTTNSKNLHFNSSKMRMNSFQQFLTKNY